jgi:hypothetical protein
MIFSFLITLLNFYIAIIPNSILEYHLSDNAKVLKNLINESKIENSISGRDVLKSSNLIIQKEYPLNYIVKNPYLKVYFFKDRTLRDFNNQIYSHQEFGLLEETILVYYFDLKVRKECLRLKSNSSFIPHICSMIQ